MSTPEFPMGQKFYLFSPPNNSACGLLPNQEMSHVAVISNNKYGKDSKYVIKLEN